MGIVTIENEKGYNFYLNKYPDHLVMFTGHNCPACITVEPMFRQMAAQHPRQVFFVVNYDNLRNTPAFQKAPLAALPTFFRNRDNVTLDRFVGTDANHLHNMMHM
jgi:thiol-disulfide isomerase/thioredoxin